MAKFARMHWFGAAAVIFLHAGSAGAQPVPAPLLEHDAALIDSHQTTSATNAQGARPYYVDTSVDPFLDQRGTGLDGSLRSEAPFGWEVNANPFAHEWNDKARYREDILVNNGRYSPTAIDLALPAPGFRWTIGRTYSIPADAPDYSSGYTGPAGHQGLDWHQFSQPEIVYAEVSGEDYIYLVYGMDRFLEFKQLDGSSAIYRGVNGAAGAIVAGVAGENDEFSTLTYWDRRGTQSVFFDPRDSDNKIVDSLTFDVFDAQGQLWTITDAAGNQAYVGHATIAESAIRAGYDDEARMQVAYDTAGRKYEYTYGLVQGTGLSSSLSATLLAAIEVFEDYDNDSVWDPTGSKVEYTYLTELEFQRGIFGNLQDVRVAIPLSGYDPAYPNDQIVTTSQRYYYHTSTINSQRGYIAARVNPEAYRQFENNESVSIDTQNFASTELRRYREFYFQTYHGGEGRLYQTNWPGEPSDGGSQVRFEYEEYNTYTHASTSGIYDPEERYIVDIREMSGGVRTHLYFDEAGQPLSERIEAGGSFPGSGGGYPDMWTYVDRDDPATTDPLDGVIWTIGHPLSIATASPNPTGGSYTPPCTLKSNTSGNPDGGAVQVFSREASTSSAFRGFMLADQWQNGANPLTTDDGPHPVYSYTYLAPARDSAAAVDVGGYLVIRPLLSAMKRHPGIDIGSGTPATEDTVYSYEFHAEAVGGGGVTDPADPQWLQYRKMVTTLPAVSTSQLGSGASETTEAYFRPEGTPVYSRDEAGIWSYQEFENGLVIKTIIDADLAQSSSYASGEAPGDYIAGVPSTADAYHLVTSQVRDELGRPVEHTLPTGRVQEGYHSALASGELTEVWSASTSGGTHTGPAMYHAYDHVGHRIVDAEIAFSGGTTTAALSGWLDDTATTPLADAVLEGELSKVDTILYHPSASVMYANRKYHELPPSGIGARRANYDEQWFEYDAARRVRGTAEMNGTIRTTTFDPYGNPDYLTLNSYVPGDGVGASGGTYSGPGGTLPNPCPEVCCAEILGFPGPYGTSFWFVQGCNSDLALTSGIGATGVSYCQRDILGRRGFIVSTDPPYEFSEYDNLGRLIAVGTYSDIPDTYLSLVSTLPTEYTPHTPDIFIDFDHRYLTPRDSVTGKASVTQNRVALVEYEYTPRGQLYKTVRHEVNQSTGALEDNVQIVYAYDETGRQIYSDGGRTVKKSYNRIGQLTDRYIVAVDDDTAGSYADLFDVDGDVVALEEHAALDPETGNAHLYIRADRKPDIVGQPQPLGRLDSNDYLDVSSLLVDATSIRGRAQITTYEFDVLDRVTRRVVHGTGDTENANDFDPSSPPTGGIAVSLTYGDDGRVAEVEDELGRVQLREYDLAGKPTQTIDNHVASGTADDENRIITWQYLDTQIYKYSAYVDATTAQVTEYSYGSTHADPNRPDYADINPTNDLLRSITYPDGLTEEFYYNNYGTLAYHVDRHGNEFYVDFDESHRPQMIELLFAGAGYGAEEGRSIEIGYDERGNCRALTDVDTNGSTPLSTLTIEYDGWGALSAFTQKDDWLDDLVGSSIVRERAVGYEWESNASGGPSSLRLGAFQYLGDTSTAVDDIGLALGYAGSTNSGLSRVASLALDGVTVASYKYIGLDRISRVDYPENNVYSTLQNGSHQYDALDRFNRVTRSRWNRTRASNEVPFYDTQVHWDDRSNVTGITDHVHGDDFNFLLVNDGLDRLTQSKRGAGSGTVISSLREQADWELGKVGTWEAHALDLNGDLNYSDSDEFQADLSFDGATPDVSINQLTTIERDTDNSPGYEETHTRTYDAHGNLTAAPDRNQIFVWDSFNRLVEVKADDGGTERTVAEFRYNALGYRIAERLDSNGDEFLDKSAGANGNGDDTVWRRLVYDANWRVVELYEVETAAGSLDESLVERYVHHAAGVEGRGTGSYIDTLVLRDRDTDGNGSLDERHYYCQNWRADVVAIIDDAGYQIEQARYSPYGVPYSIPFADQNLDGAINSFDNSTFSGRLGGGYDVRADANLDGSLSFFDSSYYTQQYSALSTGAYGRGMQSAYGHHPGYAGYWWIPELSLNHVRYRWYDAATGTWISKDPSGYVDGLSLYGYVLQAPLVYQDPLGLYGNSIVPPGSGTRSRWRDWDYTDEEEAQFYSDLPGNLAQTGVGLLAIAASPEIAATVGVRRGITYLIKKGFGKDGKIIGTRFRGNKPLLNNNNMIRLGWSIQKSNDGLMKRWTIRITGNLCRGKHFNLWKEPWRPK